MGREVGGREKRGRGEKEEEGGKRRRRKDADQGEEKRGAGRSWY